MKLLIDSLSNLASHSSTKIVREPDWPYLVENSEPANIDIMLELFELQFGFQCPQAYTILFGLAVELHFVWKAEKCGGECLLRDCLTTFSEPMGSDFKHLDKADFELSTMLALDQVVESSGPHYVVFDKKEPERLFVTDLESFEPLLIGPAEYFEKLRITRGIDYWQYLFVANPIRNDRREALRQGIEYCKSIAPEDNNVGSLEARLNSR